MPKFDANISTLTTQHWAWCMEHLMQVLLVCLCFLQRNFQFNLKYNHVHICQVEINDEQYILPALARILTLTKCTEANRDI